MSVAARKLAKDREAVSHSFTNAERDTILAALRLWQWNIDTQRKAPTHKELEVIATNGGEHKALTSEEINALCADLNQ